MKKENSFQRDLIKELYERFPGCMVLKNDANYKQGIPDLIVLSGKGWAMLECKRSEKEARQRNSSSKLNQEYYVEKLNQMSYSSFIYPENKEDVLNELSKTFGAQE